MNSKVLFVYPDYKYLPISPAFVIPVLKKYDIDFDYLDMHRNPDLLGTLERGGYTHIATTGLVLDFAQVEEVFQTARAFDENIGTILGGRISACPDHLLERMPVDFVVAGDADPTMGELMDAIDSGATDFSGIRSIAYRENGKLVRTEKRKQLPLDNLNAAWEDVDLDYYLTAEVENNFWVKGFPIVSGLGCVGKCTFCAPGIRGIRTRPVENIIEEMKWADKRFDFNYFCFVSEVFYPSVKDMRSFCEAYKASGINKPWVCNMRADFDPELLDIVAGAGCKYIFVGIESFDDMALHAMGKNTTEALLRTFIQRALDNGLQVMTGVMAGNLGDTSRSIEKTVDFLSEMELISYGIAPLFVYPGTRVYDEAVKRGVIQDEFTFCKSFFRRQWDTSISGPNYPNVTAMPLEDLRESYAHARYRIEKYMTLKYTPTSYDMEGDSVICNNCGKPIPLTRGGNVMYVCTECLATHQVNIFHLMITGSEVNATIKEAMTDSSRVVVIGPHYFVKSLMWLAESYGADPDSIVFIGGGFHLSHEQNRIDFEQIKATDTVLFAGLTFSNKAREALERLGVPAERIINATPPSYKRYLEKEFDGKENIFPDTCAEDSQWFAEVIAKDLLEKSGPDSRWAVGPAGAFGVNMCKGFIAAGANVVSMIDSYKQVDDVGIGIPSVHPSELDRLGVNKVFLATPSPSTQDVIGDAVVANCSLEAGDVFKLKDMYRQYWDLLFI